MSQEQVRRCIGGWNTAVTKSPPTPTDKDGSDHRTYHFYSRYEKEFENVQDVFELQVWLTRLIISSLASLHGSFIDTIDLQRNLNNAFAYDLVPSPSVCVAALKAARRVNDYPTAVRVFEGSSRLARCAGK